MDNMSTAKKVTIYAFCTALVCVSTAVIQIPIPLGYMHLGNTLILLSAYLFGPWVGLIAGGLGSALADLITGFAYWCLPTVIIKGIMGLVIGLFAYRLNKHKKLFSVSTAAGAVFGIAVMIIGYFIAGSVIYGSIYTGALQIPGLTIEGLIGIGLFFLAAAALEKAGIRKLLRDQL